MATPEIINRARQIAAVMPEKYPFGFAIVLAEGEVRGDKMPWDASDEAWQERLVREGRVRGRVGA